MTQANRGAGDDDEIEPILSATPECVQDADIAMLSHQLSLIAALALVVPYVQDCECERPDTDPDLGADQAKIVFVTAGNFQGNLGGLAGADLRCTGQAALAGLSGTYTAWLSDPTGDASTRITDSSAGYARVDGTVIASDLDDLLDGVLDAPINLTQFGGEREVRVWTNTTTLGVAAGAFDCSGWTSNGGGDGWVGLSIATNGNWTNFTTDAACSGSNSLYCFED